MRRRRGRLGPKVSLPRARTWEDDAACIGEDLNVFFPESQSAEAVRPAKEVCSRCQVVDSCREWALSRPEQYGVWGGLAEDERAEILAAKRRAKERARRKAKRQAELARAGSGGVPGA